MTPEMQVTRVLHVGLNATGWLADVRRFYQSVLGFELTARPATLAIPGFWLASGASQLHIVGAPDSDDLLGPKGNHYCLAVQDINSAVDFLELHRVPYAEAGGLPVRQIWLRDPAGGAIELQQDTDFGFKNAS
ncbi:MAG: VOC family protein [Solirubrobacteraceae bacterium]